MKIFSTILAAILILGATLWYWRHETLYPNTDDAYVQAHILTISPQVSGKVEQIFVKNNQLVQTNQKLFTIQQKPFIYNLNQAKANLTLAKKQIAALIEQIKISRANLAEKKAAYVNSQKNAQRILALVKQGRAAVSEGDNASTQAEEAKANYLAAQNQLLLNQKQLGQPGPNNAEIKQAEAKLNQAKLDLSHTIISAPSNGFISNLTLRSGTIVSPGQALFSLIENKQWWVAANFKETDLKRIQPGQKAKIKLDIYPDHTFNGIVQSISYGSGSTFSLLPPENATGNWVKVTQRFTVKVDIINPNPKYPLRVGASSTVQINTLS